MIIIHLYSRVWHLPDNPVINKMSSMDLEKNITETCFSTHRTERRFSLYTDLINRFEFSIIKKDNDHHQPITIVIYDQIGSTNLKNTNPR